MRQLVINERQIRLVLGDITTCQVDAIVNAANSGLRGGGGVDGAIHRAGGPAILDECKRMGWCPTGQARITTAGRLQARYVIHAVGPMWHDGEQDEPELLASAYRWSLQLAEEKGLTSIAFPAISVGAYGYPVHEAAPIAIEVVASHLQQPGSLQSITFVLFTPDKLAAFEKALAAVAGQYSTNPDPAESQEVRY